MICFNHLKYSSIKLIVLVVLTSLAFSLPLVSAADDGNDGDKEKPNTPLGEKHNHYQFWVKFSEALDLEISDQKIVRNAGSEADADELNSTSGNTDHCKNALNKINDMFLTDPPSTDPIILGVRKTFTALSKGTLRQWQHEANIYWSLDKKPASEQINLENYYHFEIHTEGKNLRSLSENLKALVTNECVLSANLEYPVIGDENESTYLVESYCDLEETCCEGTENLACFRDKQYYLEKLGFKDNQQVWIDPDVFGGENINLGLIELGWCKDNSDFVKNFSSIGASSKTGSHQKHGNAVLGVMAAPRNLIGIDGMTPGANITLQSVWSDDSCDDDHPNQLVGVANAILGVSEKIGSGGVVAIPLQALACKTKPLTICKATCETIKVPVELSKPTFEAIRSAVAQGVTIVEAAGNGSTNLDNGPLGRRFDSGNDSGAIIVGAANKSGGRFSSSNYGSMVKIYAYGEAIASLNRCNAYDGFGNTSSATPMVASAAVAIQSFLKTKNEPFLESKQIRCLLKNTGAPLTDDNGAKIPNIPEAIEYYSNPISNLEFRRMCLGN